jgi:hypothetical protein
VPIRFTWRQRRIRAGKLQTDHPHAAELLAFYARVLELQEPLYRRAAGTTPSTRLSATSSCAAPSRCASTSWS